MLASGNLGLVYFPDVPHRMSRQEVDRRHPGLLPALAGHPGVGFVLVRCERHGSVVLAADGSETPVADLADGAGPLAAFGPGAARAIRRADGFPHVADVMVNSAYDPRTDRVHAFEDQIGSHGGLGGDQGEAFLLWPRDLSAPAAAGRRWWAPRPCTACCAAGWRRGGPRRTRRDAPAPVREQPPAHHADTPPAPAPAPDGKG